MCKTVILNHFRRLDPAFYRLAQRVDPIIWQPKPPQTAHERYLKLCQIIVNQQLSVNSAQAIWRRLQPILIQDPSISKTDLFRKAGLSRSKIGYLRSLRALDLAVLEHLDDSDLAASLLTYHGVGQWTADMILLSIYGRPDIFSWSDLVLRRSAAAFYALDETTDFQLLQTKINCLRPYRSSAALILWHWYGQEKT